MEVMVHRGGQNIPLSSTDLFQFGSQYRFLFDFWFGLIVGIDDFF
jgi:hypothetical protein